jgi:hypothetical protein
VTTLIVAAAAGSLCAGFAVGRWLAVPLAAATWPLYLLGRSEGWWGNGVGDGWEVSLAVGAAVAALGAAAGVLARQTTRRASFD